MAVGINWSVPTLIETSDDGTFRVTIPEKAVKGLNISEGDVLCFTGFENNAVEVWPVKKGEYKSLDDAGVAAEAMARTVHSSDDST